MNALRAARHLPVAATALGMSAALIASGPAYASCTEDSGPSGSPVVFVGVADEQRAGFTRFAVAEVWAGPDLAPEVWVLSGQEQPRWPLGAFTAVGSSVDAEFRDGDAYVVGATRAFKTNACQVAEASDDAVMADQPDETRAPTPSGAEGADPPIGPLGQTMWLAGVLAALAACIALVRRRRVHGRSVP